ncbi:hypothetical protein RJ639_014979 [Escallonia herrerae]|uniref:Uncharacterized protein n=1 Tax=Escallonia herrerae TaxID=1293975 RepID=A0AA89ANI2_9ASTE|nr:hypothetical protein RJ639_014979 [Escallonia herrerae]
MSDRLSQTLVSAGKTFQLGFFTPDGSSSRNRYLGIWYCVDPKTVVWVANRDQPLSDYRGVLAIAEDGNLKLVDASGKSYFSTRPESSGSQAPRSSITVRLFDNGNLVLQEDDHFLWQSFVNQVTDTFIPGMSMKGNLKLTSWTSRVDPAKGNFTFQQDEEGDKGYIVWNKSTPYWKSGGSNIFAPSQMFDAALFLLNNKTRNVIKILNNSNVSFQPPVRDIRLVMNYSGHIQYFSWDNNTTQWILYWSEPKDGCSVYDACGKFAICGTSNPHICNCLSGFQPNSPEKWDSGDFSSGCVKKSTACDKDRETFMNLSMMRVGSTPEPCYEVESEQNCRVDCLDKCQCQAYSFIARNDSTRQRGSRSPAKTEKKCCFWTTALSDLHDGYASADGGHNLSIRVAVPDPGPKQGQEEHRRKRVSLPQKPVIIFAVVTTVAWNLWKEGNGMSLLDQTLAESCNTSEVLKCISIALLCVQEDPGDRPTMSNVVFMLGSETGSLPIPKQPAFVATRRLSGTASSSSNKPETQSTNDLTVSMPEPR